VATGKRDGVNKRCFTLIKRAISTIWFRLRGCQWLWVFAVYIRTWASMFKGGMTSSSSRVIKAGLFDRSAKEVLFPIRARRKTKTSIKQEKLKKNYQNKWNTIYIFMTFRIHRQKILCYFTSTSVADSENQIKKCTGAWNPSRMPTFRGQSAKRQSN